MLLRGLHLASVLMPQEGWDEYQHLAVVAVLDERGTFPDYRDPIPESFLKYLQGVPLPDVAVRQLSSIGAQNYRGEIWWEDRFVPASSIQVPAGGEGHGLYQAQQGPLYYGVLLFLIHGFGLEEYSAWGDLGRLLNVILMAGTSVLWFFLFQAICPRRMGYLPLLLCVCVAMNSLYIYNFCRVTNDVLAVFLSTLAMLISVWGFKFMKESRSNRFLLCLGGVLGLLVGLAVLAKTYALVVIPALVLGAAWRFIRQGPGWRRVILFSAPLLLGYLLVAGPWHWDSLTRYQTLTPMQEAIQNQETGRGLFDAVSEVDYLLDRTLIPLFKGYFFAVGGWSVLLDGSLSWLHYRLVQLAWVGLVLALLFGFSRRRIIELWGQHPEIGFCLLFFCAAFFYHGYQSFLAYGITTTSVRYAAMVFPLLLLVYFTGAAALHPALGLLLGFAFVLVWGFTHLHLTYGLVIPHQTGLIELQDSLEVIGSYHSFLEFSSPWIHGGEALLLLGMVVLHLMQRRLKLKPS